MRSGSGALSTRGTNLIRNQGYCVRRLISTELHLSVFSAETISSEKMSIDISNTL